MTDNIRWIQRLGNWTKALGQLTRFMDRTELNELEELGMIHAFENNHDLAWKIQKEYLGAQGYSEMFGPRNVAKRAFEIGLIDNCNVWMEMAKNHNLLLQTYNEESRDKIVAAIVGNYYPAFCALHIKLTEMARKEQCSKR
jgi:nucleotidyltransferase substrate binding protein (TIGR01987 family)